ncbi:uncharacterized conserved protein [Pelotomaculum thermopropionicum SI]|uniref:Uncharacterized conserved protein n=1 Tax=Pelotomaculum thermopropionicum (strain DSM 13744 / JCM 10971 / SI) TaxID=370438 RepID=A5D1V7_PELTS|nr:uncharacterized conserved protein [Pelotomaculum thermopropionicum SI]
MKIAMPLNKGKINEHFGSSREFIILEIYNGKIIDKKIIANEIVHNRGGLAQFLKEEGVEVVIAKGISRPMAETLYYEGLYLITGAEGEVERIVEDFLSGQLVSRPVVCACGGHN